jgi:mannosyltransferase OCH1-like enzyme
LEILWEFGGIYVDADFECLKPVDDLLDDTSFAAAWEIQDAYLANGFLAAPPGHPFTAFLRDGISESLRRHSRDHRPNRTTGPRYLTPMYRLWTAQGGQSVRTLDQAAFFPYGYDDVGTPRENPPWPESSYAVHHWNNRRRTLGTAP